jgi:hypothetical protein
MIGRAAAVRVIMPRHHHQTSLPNHHVLRPQFAMSSTTQQRGDDRQPDLCARRGPCLLLVLCGLPATGKSSFASAAAASVGDACTLFPPSAVDNASNPHERRCHVHHVCADALYAREVEKRGAGVCDASAAANDADRSDGSGGGGGDFDRDAWQQSRSALRDETEALLARFAPNPTSDSSQDARCHHHIIIVDDNMHLRSMVRPYMSLARQCTLTRFCNVPFLWVRTFIFVNVLL